MQFQDHDFLRRYSINEERTDDNLTEMALHKILSQSVITAKMEAMKQALLRLQKARSRPPQVQHRNFSFIERNFFSWAVRKQICKRYKAEGLLNRTVLSGTWQKFNRYVPDDVTMTVHLNVAKLDTLDLLLSYWPGPVSIAADIKIYEIDLFLAKLTTSFKHWVSRDNIDFHFVRNDGVSSDMQLSNYA